MVKQVAQCLIGLLLATAMLPASATTFAQNTALPDVTDPIFSDGFEAIAGAGSIVINEVDYVQPGVDGAEYIELYNPGAASVSLDGLKLQLIDGANNSPYAEVVLDPVSLAAGAFYVVCDNPVRVPNCDQQVDLTVPWIQDGNPDGVALSGPAGLIDALSYGGSLNAPWVEGAGSSTTDDSRVEGVSLGRFPNGSDSNDNDTDFRLGCITPGAANTETALDCPTFTVSGTVSGLNGSGLVLQLDREQIYNLTITQDGSFQFAKQIVNGSDYEVRVFLQPTEPNQTCTVTNGVGFIAGADITDVEVICVNDGTDFSVGGTVSGLVAGSFVVLTDNVTFEFWPVYFNGPFTFPQKRANGTAYDVVAGQSPISPVTCEVNNGSGTINGADVTDIEVVCVPTTYTVGGTVRGLLGDGLILQNNGTDDLPISGNGIFTFAGQLEQGEAYAVTVKEDPTGPSQTCFVTGGGNISDINVTTIIVTCALDNPEPGTIIITEVMAAPLGTDNENGEWFELRNLGPDYLFLKDCTLSNDTTDHLITAEALIDPNETVVFAKDAEQVRTDRILGSFFLYADISLSNSADSLELSCDSTVVDAMTYTNFTEGAARQLDADNMDAVANDDPANWCDATTLLSSGNLGTPGNQNRTCP
jgi:hypothetical protein